MGNVGERVSELCLGERAARPVGEARGLVDPRLGEVVGELLVGDRIAESAHHCRDLRVEQRLRHEFAEIPDDLEVLARRVENLHHRAVRHQRHERGEVHALRERVDKDRLVRRGHLDQAELRIVGGLAQEFGVYRDEGVRSEAAARCGERIGRGDQVHEARSSRSRAIVRPPSWPGVRRRGPVGRLPCGACAAAARRSRSASRGCCGR